MDRYREQVVGLEGESLQQGKVNLALLLAESSFALIQFWKYEDCEAAIEEALGLLELGLDLAGKMGRLTKWQSYDVAQLVLDIKGKGVTLGKRAEAGIEGEKSQLYIKQEEDSILLEQPNLTADAEEEKAPDLSKIQSKELLNHEKVVIQAYVNYLFKSLPDKDEQTFETIRPYVAVCVLKESNWLTFSKALLYRSKNEI